MIKILLHCENIGVSFGAHQVFACINLSLAAGAYVLQGPNGIGKSTLLRVLAGIQTTDHGEVWLDGQSFRHTPLAAKRCLSYVPDESCMYPFMTGQDLLDLVSSAKNAKIDDSIEQLTDIFDLRRHLNVRFDGMSLGTQKKMMLCAGLIGAPRVMLMDEPSNGLDVASRRSLEAIIRTRSKENVILVSTHDDEFTRAIEASSILMADLIY